MCLLNLTTGGKRGKNEINNSPHALKLPVIQLPAHPVVLPL